MIAAVANSFFNEISTKATRRASITRADSPTMTATARIVIRPTNCDQTVTANARSERDAKPPMKSAEPYMTADSAARSTPTESA